MKKNILLIVLATLLVASCANMNRLATENRMLKSNIRELLDNMEANDDIEKYEGSDMLINLQHAVYKPTKGRVTK